MSSNGGLGQGLTRSLTITNCGTTDVTLVGIGIYIFFGNGVIGAFQVCSNYHKKERKNKKQRGSTNCDLHVVLLKR